MRRARHLNMIVARLWCALQGERKIFQYLIVGWGRVSGWRGYGCRAVLCTVIHESGRQLRVSTVHEAYVSLRRLGRERRRVEGTMRGMCVHLSKKHGCSRYRQWSRYAPSRSNTELPNQEKSGTGSLRMALKRQDRCFFNGASSGAGQGKCARS